MSRAVLARGLQGEPARLPLGGSAKRRKSGAERRGGDLLTPWKYSARRQISGTFLRRAVLSGVSADRTLPRPAGGFARLRTRCILLRFLSIRRGIAVLEEHGWAS